MIDAVLPLVISDFERFRILDRSLQTFHECLGAFWIVTRDDQYQEMKRRLKGHQAQLLPESAIIPEFYQNQSVGGWHRQQLVKLAMSRVVGSEVYLTLDADVICTRLIRESDLIHDGKARTYRYRSTKHDGWYRHASRVLGVPPSEWRHAVTPTLLTREGVARLVAYLKRRYVTGILARLERQLKWGIQPTVPHNWREALITSLPWTEYSLYHTFLEQKELIDRFHCQLVNPLSNHNLWGTNPEPFNDWDPALAFDQSAGHCFTVIQSRCNIPPKRILEKVGPYLQGAGKTRPVPYS